MIQKLKSFSKTTGKFFLCALVAFAMFGLLLAIFWQFPWRDSVSFKLTAVLTAAGVSIIAGGFWMGKWSPANPIQIATGWGLLAGMFSFGYIFGIEWQLLVAVPASGLIAGFGGYFSKPNVRGKP